MGHVTGPKRPTHMIGRLLRTLKNKTKQNPYTSYKPLHSLLLFPWPQQYECHVPNPNPWVLTPGLRQTGASCLTIRHWRYSQTVENYHTLASSLLELMLAGCSLNCLRLSIAVHRLLAGLVTDPVQVRPRSGSTLDPELELGLGRSHTRPGPGPFPK